MIFDGNSLPCFSYSILEEIPYSVPIDILACCGP